MTDACRVLIVDDHVMFRQGLRALLEDSQGLVVVGEAADGLEALEKARQLRPDVVLMDIQMPICDGLKATSDIRREIPHAKIIVLTVHGNDPDLVYQAIKAGAMGYVPKLSDVEDLVRTIRLVVQGQAGIASPTLTSLVTFISSAPDSSKDRASLADTLSPREHEVLDLVAEGSSNRQIASRLCISESTVRSHLHNILGKLHFSNRVQAATFALALRQAERGAAGRLQPQGPPGRGHRPGTTRAPETRSGGAPGQPCWHEHPSSGRHEAPKRGPRSGAS